MYKDFIIIWSYKIKLYLLLYNWPAVGGAADSTENEKEYGKHIYKYLIETWIRC